MSDTKIDNRITALYCRLSQDDGNVGDSMSITSQKAILEKTAREMGFHNTSFYVDDGYSGTNFNRPAFKQMIADIEEGKIGTVLSKDLSRLGRNYIESGSYIEIFFPQHDVRYIAVNDGVDTINSSEMDITPFKNILNEMYSRDISKKIKSGKLIRAQQGKFMGVTAPFGLKKDPADKNHLIIDEETAPTVRFIYDLALKGNGTLRINKKLEEKGFPRPAYYKPEYFDMSDHPERVYHWDEETVTRILRNPVYKGYMWVNHTSKRSLRQKDRGYIRIKDRVIVEADHEAIIPPDEWDAVQDILDRHTKIKPCTGGDENIFRGLIFCPDCGMALLIHYDHRRKGEDAREKTCFQCRTYRVRGKKVCTQHRIEAVDLEDAVLADIQAHARKAIKDKDKFIHDVMRRMGANGQDKAKALSDKVAKLKRENAEADERYVKLYGDLSEGIITETKFKMLSGRIEEKQAKVNAEIEKLEKQIEGAKADAEAVRMFADQLTEAVTIKELSSELLNRLIEKIEVSEKECRDGETTQTVRIYYKFVGALI